MTSFVQPDMFAKNVAQWPFGDLRPHAYGFIMIDPPWHMDMYSQAGEGKSPQAYYSTMSLDDIAALPVRDLAAADCCIWVWGTTPLLPRQIGIMETWGFKYSTNAVWAKRTVNGERCFGTGYGGFRGEHEHIIVGKIGSPKHHYFSERSIVEGEAREYSRKPEAAYLAAERLYPNLRKADVFSRERRVGWDSFGDQLDAFEPGGSAGRKRVKVATVAASYMFDDTADPMLF